MIFILISVSICEKSLSRGNFTLKCICTVELYTYTHDQTSYTRKFFVLLAKKDEKKKWSKTASPVSDCFTFFFFFFPVIFSFISSLPLSFFLSYSMLCLFEHQAWTLLCIDATFSPPPSQRDPSNEDNRNEKTVKKGKKIKVMKQADKKRKKKKVRSGNRTETKQWSCDTTLMYTIFQHENIIYCSYTYRSI